MAIVLPAPMRPHRPERLRVLARGGLLLVTILAIVWVSVPTVGFIAEVASMKNLEPCERYGVEPGLAVTLDVHSAGYPRGSFFRSGWGSFHDYVGPGGAAVELAIGAAELRLSIPHCS